MTGGQLTVVGQWSESQKKRATIEHLEKNLVDVDREVGVVARKLDELRTEKAWTERMLERIRAELKQLEE